MISCNVEGCPHVGPEGIITKLQEREATLERQINDFYGKLDAIQGTVEHVSQTVISLKNPVIEIQNGKKEKKSLHEVVGETYVDLKRQSQDLQEISKKVKDLSFVKIQDPLDDKNISYQELNVLLNRLVNRPQNTIKKFAIMSDNFTKIILFIQMIILIVLAFKVF